MKVLRESNSNWNSPSWQPKSDRTVHFSVDFCIVNSVSKFFKNPQAYGLPLGSLASASQMNKTAAIVDSPQPKTKKQMRQFLGMAGTNHRFLPNYSDLRRMLRSMILLKKEAPEQCLDSCPWLLSPFCVANLCVGLWVGGCSVPGGGEQEH